MVRRRSPASATRHAAEPGLGEGLLTGVELSTVRNLVGWRPHDGHPAVVALDAVECEGVIERYDRLATRHPRCDGRTHRHQGRTVSIFDFDFSGGTVADGRIPPPLTVIQFDTKGWNLKLSKYSRWSENIA